MKFIKLAVQDGDGAIAFAERGFEFGDLGVFGGEPGSQRGDDAVVVVRRGRDVIGDGRTGGLGSALRVPHGRRCAGNPGSAGHAADGDGGALAAQSLDGFVNAGPRSSAR